MVPMHTWISGLESWLYSRFCFLVSLTSPTKTSQCCSNESGHGLPHGHLILQHSGSQLQGSAPLLGQFFLPGRDLMSQVPSKMAPGHVLPGCDTFGRPGRSLLYSYLCKCTLLLGLPWCFRWYRICLQCGRPRFSLWVRKIPWRNEWLLLLSRFSHVRLCATL